VQDGEVRGVLEPTYVPLDSEILANFLPECVKAGLSPTRINYDGDSLVAQFITAIELKANKAGDISQIGITCETSDIGAFSLSAHAYARRLVCLNGTTLPANLGGEVSFKHKSVNESTVWELFREGYQRILSNLSKIDSEFIIRLENRKVDAAGFVKAKNKLSEFAGGRKINVLLEGMEQELLEKGSDFNFYNIYNKITESARDSASLYEARNLEKAAGELLFEFGSKAN
jgi:hypothetical protein